ncbi:hypothetical protein [Arthrobacter sp. ISL-30]|uniref:hypothetical protein n=1 Tax=Arthrobacter sp. ISL-30 TaxID=2819109 RepID=UPI001BE8102A|nr:hypothetical protein [Arthrobacter sp. ISL-30]MBT2513486.1 hypothetical protein [Arthrobacter sp. ISL-30]
MKGPVKDMMETVTAKQGTQPHIHGVRIGVMRLGRPEGIGVARLALRSDDESRIELLREGESVELFGQGTLTLRTVLLPGGEFQRGAVVLDFEGGPED